MKYHDVIIVGAGAAGLMCAATAGYRNRKVLLLDNAKQAGRKILISGGGRCNFTNQKVTASNFICNNPHFVKSALARYSPQDFISLIERHGIDYHCREHGQYFCDNSAKEIVAMLRRECDLAKVQIQLTTNIERVDKNADGSFELLTSKGHYQCRSLVIASGGLSLPKLGATAFGYRLAEQFGINVLPTRAGLVPLTWQNKQKQKFQPLAGIALPTSITAKDGSQFGEALLFTHRGLSGPAILQISNYWKTGESIVIDLLPNFDVATALAQAAIKHPKQSLRNTLNKWLPKRLNDALCDPLLLQLTLNQIKATQYRQITTDLHHWQLSFDGTEGYRTAEVTLGGVDTNELSSKDLQSNKVPGLFFIGEVVDVTGWLGGFNFQWAWSSGVAAGHAL